MIEVSRRSAFALLAAALLPVQLGCDTALYLYRQGLGQFDMLLRTRPIEDVLSEGALEAEPLGKLKLVIDARRFARQELGLRVGGSFGRFNNTAGKPIGWNLSAAPRDALRARQWRFPIIGAIDYIGYFSKADGQAAEARLQAEGYDTWLRPVSAYSTLGWLPDPLHSTMLRYDDGTLVDTVIHELAHNTVYANGQSDFNESLATFIGREGARRFFEARGDYGREVLEQLRRRRDDDERVNAWMEGVVKELRAYYKTKEPAEEKIAGRESVFEAARRRFADEVRPQLNEPGRYRTYAELPTNNAFILLNQRYNRDLSLFASAYECCGRDIGRFIEMLRAAARQRDGFAALRRRVNEATSQPATSETRQ
ncbi:hypothetical protein RAS1_34580 [Phycisphaerae bacterium RAS1]|nr:hypothetical protein RAS1_34580 [Phycisphaerae bacterium RAS1]